jgi:hypothetical protein
MFSIAYKRSLTTLAVAGGLLIAAAPASAQAPRSVSDGTSNTIFSAAVGVPTANGYSFGASQTGSFVKGGAQGGPASVACDGIGA